MESTLIIIISILVLLIFLFVLILLFRIDLLKKLVKLIKPDPTPDPKPDPTFSSVNLISAQYLRDLGYNVQYGNGASGPTQGNAIILIISNLEIFLTKYNHSKLSDNYKICKGIDGEKVYMLIHNLKDFLDKVSPISQAELEADIENGVLQSGRNYFMFSNPETPSTGTATSSAGPKRDGFADPVTADKYYEMLNRNDYLQMQSRFNTLTTSDLNNHTQRHLIGFLDSGFDPTTDGINRLSLNILNYIPTPSLLDPDPIHLNVTRGNRNIVDNCGHGSRIFEILHSTLDANQSGIHLLPIKVLDGNGVCTVFDLICGIKLAHNLNVNLLNISIGYYDNSIPDHQLLCDVIRDYLAFPNRRIFCSAGNDGLRLSDSENHYPSGLALQQPNLFEVFASENLTDFQLGSLQRPLASYSNRRSNYRNALVCSGNGFSASTDFTTFFDNKYQCGTSFACPRALAMYVNNSTYYSLIRNNANDFHSQPNSPNPLAM